MGRYNKFTLGGQKSSRSLRFYKPGEVPAKPTTKVATDKTMTLESVAAMMQERGFLTPIGVSTGISQEGGDVKEVQDKVIEAAKNAWEVYNHSFRAFLLECLSDRGVVFHDNAQFEQFVEAHITCANHEGTTDNSVFLDFVDLDNRGDLLFTYSSAVSTQVDEVTGEINIKIG